MRKGRGHSVPRPFLSVGLGSRSAFGEGNIAGNIEFAGYLPLAIGGKRIELPVEIRMLPARAARDGVGLAVVDEYEVRARPSAGLAPLETTFYGVLPGSSVDGAGYRDPVGAVSPVSRVAPLGVEHRVPACKGVDRVVAAAPIYPVPLGGTVDPLRSVGAVAHPPVLRAIEARCRILQRRSCQQGQRHTTSHQQDESHGGNQQNGAPHKEGRLPFGKGRGELRAFPRRPVYK